MSTKIVPFDKGSMPTSVGSGRFDTTPNLVVAGGFPVISIRGKAFHIVRGGDEELITKDVDGEAMPAPYIDIVVVHANPNVSKIYYEKEYKEGDDAAPTCYSVNGDRPEPDSESPQAKNCATCKHNVWGSRMTDDGRKAKACSDARRVAVAAPDAIDDPMLLRVPPTSLKGLGEYQQKLSKHGVAIQEVVTRLKFDPTLAHPMLLFKPQGFIDDPVALDAIEQGMGTALVQQIIGAMPTEAQEQKALTRENLLEDDDDDDDVDAVMAEMEGKTPPKKAAAKKAAPKKKAATKKAAKPKPKVEEEPEVEDTDESDDDLVSKAQDALNEFDDFDGFNGYN